MIADTCARKATAQDDRSEQAWSVTRQVENAKAYAATRGWTVADEDVFVDDGSSGCRSAIMLFGSEDTFHGDYGRPLEGAHGKGLASPTGTVTAWTHETIRLVKAA